MGLFQHSANPQEDRVSKITTITVVTLILGGMVLFGLIGCLLTCCIRCSRNRKFSPNCRLGADVEATAGLAGHDVHTGTVGTACADTARLSHAGSRTTSSATAAAPFSNVILTPVYPAPVYQNSLRPQATHWPLESMEQPPQSGSATQGQRTRDV